MVFRSAVLSAVSAVACLALAGSAFASRPAHPSESRAIARAIRSSPDTRGVRGKFDVMRVRISTVDRHWAVASVEPKKPYRHQLDGATAVVHLAHSRWSVRTLGTSDVGCVVHSLAVRRDLDLGCGA